MTVTGLRRLSLSPGPTRGSDSPGSLSQAAQAATEAARPAPGGLPGRAAVGVTSACPSGSGPKQCPGRARPGRPGPAGGCSLGRHWQCQDNVATIAWAQCYLSD